MLHHARFFALAALVMCAAALWAPARAGALIQNPGTLQCIGLPAMEPLTGPLSLPCAPNGLSQWTIQDGHIMTDVYQVAQGGDARAMCLDLAGGIEGDPVELNGCSTTIARQFWTIDRGHFVNRQTKECMSRIEGKGKNITMQDCIFSGKGTNDQVWVLD